jgi:nitrous oxidase accessory protein
MRRVDYVQILLLVALTWLPSVVLATSRTHLVSPQGPYTSLEAAIRQANDGDTIVVHGGHYAGPLVVSKRLIIRGQDWPVIDGRGQGTVIKLTAPGITLSGFVIRNSGSSLEEENSAIAVDAPAAVIQDNRLEDTLFGIYLRQAANSRIRGNVIHGKDLAMPRRGDGIRVWYSNGVQIEANQVERGRDVVLWYSQHLFVRGNTVRHGRYGLHFMYCDDTRIEANRLMHNSVGAFLMYTRRLHLERNLIASNRGPSGYGIGLKDVDDAVIEQNVFLDNRVGAFVDNSPREVDSLGEFTGNVFAYNTMGVSLMPSVRRNWFSGNSFVENQAQVHVAGGGQLRQNVWTVHERGNYWSDYLGYDANGDGIGDIPYRAERLFEDLLDRYPMLQLFLHSPIVQAIDLATRAFPLVKPQSKVTDTAPLMAVTMPTALPAVALPPRRLLLSVALGLLGAAVVLSFSVSWRPSSRLRSRDGGEPRMLVVENLTKRFGAVTAVQALSVAVQRGEAVALWGANGAGKTTLLRCILGLLPYTGTVRLGGYDVRQQGKAARQLVGFVPQELGFYDDLTVQETLTFYGRLKRLDEVDGAAILERVGLTQHTSKPVRSLSGGMKQRLALALALLGEPPLLVLDEPTANLDAGARADLVALLAELKASGKTLLFSSHRLEEVQALADRVLVLEDGRLLSAAPPHTLPTFGNTLALRLYLAGELLEPALATLTAQGFQAARNSTSLRVQVHPGAKGAPLQALSQAQIAVTDFDLEHDERGHAHA